MVKKNVDAPPQKKILEMKSPEVDEVELRAPRIGYKYLFKVYKVTFSFRSVRSGGNYILLHKEELQFQSATYISPAP